DHESRVTKAPDSVTTHPSPTLSLVASYRAECARLGYAADEAQERVVARLEDLRQRLLAPTPRTGGLQELLSRKRACSTVRGIYLWRGVCRGKTWLMDLFFHSLHLKNKQRSHYHRFTQAVKDELKKHADECDPLEGVDDKIGARARV